MIIIIIKGNIKWAISYSHTHVHTNTMVSTEGIVEHHQSCTSHHTHVLEAVKTTYNILYCSDVSINTDRDSSSVMQFVIVVYHDLPYEVQVTHHHVELAAHIEPARDRHWAQAQYSAVPIMLYL